MMRKTTSSIDTNELTDMDRKEELDTQNQETFATNMLMNVELQQEGKEDSRNQYPTFAKQSPRLPSKAEIDVDKIP